MAAAKGRKVEIQVDVRSQEQWEELMAKNGLIIVDAYAGWCGPCKAIESTFRRIRNETGDDLLHFAMAETDNIEPLESYRNKSRPTFLFFGGGQLVNVVRGCDAPLLGRSISHFLSEERRVLNGDIEREVFIDVEAQLEKEKDEKQDSEKGDEKEEDEIEIVEVPKEISVVIIKPDALKNGHADMIIENIESCGIEVLHQEEKVLSKEEAAEFYKQHEGSEHFEELIEFMSSGPVLTLVISKRGDDPGYGLIPEIRELIGPKDVNLAKEEAPSSIRAQYGTDEIMNAVHACDSSKSAAKELAFFYPDFNVPKVHEKRKKPRIQRTLALIRPGAYAQRKDSILRTVEEAGFSIAMSKEMYLSKEQAEEFYEEHRGKDYFESLVNNMTSGPSLALCLAREDAVDAWRNMLGPKEVSLAKEEAPESLRAVFAEDDADINPLHGADSIEAAEKELRAFFPEEATVAVIKPEAYSVPEQRDEIVNKIKQAGFKISAQKEIGLTKDLAAQFYKEHEGKEFYEGLTDYMSSGPTLFLILSKEDAISGFRALVGPTDPELAKEESPNSLRAMYATDRMMNAIHSSSSTTRAVDMIHEFFPEIELNPDGTIKEPEKEVAEKAEEDPEGEESEKVVEGKTEETDDNNETGKANEPGESTQGEGGEGNEVQENNKGEGETLKETDEDVNNNDMVNDSKDEDVAKTDVNENSTGTNGNVEDAVKEETSEEQAEVKDPEPTDASNVQQTETLEDDKGLVENGTKHTSDEENNDPSEQNDPQQSEPDKSESQQGESDKNENEPEKSEPQQSEPDKNVPEQGEPEKNENEPGKSEPQQSEQEKNENEPEKNAPEQNGENKETVNQGQSDGSEETTGQTADTG